MFIKFFLTLFLFFSLTVSACEKPTMPSAEEWDEWLTEVKKEAASKGIRQKTISQYLLNVKPQKKIILRDRCQPESTITLEEYLFYRVVKDKIVAGRNVLKDHEAILSEISNHFGIHGRCVFEG